MQSNGHGGRQDVSAAAIDSDRAQLSAIAATLDEITRRVGDIAGGYQGTTREDLAHDLFEVERSLLTAARRLDKARRGPR